MRCWTCHKLIPLPDTINLAPGSPGMLRAGERGEVAIERLEFPQPSMTVKFSCPHCRSIYQTVTAIMEGKAEMKKATVTESEGE